MLDKNGNAMLVPAAQHGHLGTIKFLIEHGANINMKGIQFCISLQFTKIDNAILDHNGNAAIALATRNQDFGLVKYHPSQMLMATQLL